MTPVEFLTARLDEREAAAKAAPGPVWCNVIERKGEPGNWRGAKARLVCLPGQPFDSLSVGDALLRAEALPLREQGAVVDHAAMNDPAYVLADIAAKRAILKLYTDTVALLPPPGAKWADLTSVQRDDFGRASSEAALLLAVIELFIQPFADHPDYDPKWAA